jgi:hypothetical protein
MYTRDGYWNAWQSCDAHRPFVCAKSQPVENASIDGLIADGELVIHIENKHIQLEASNDESADQLQHWSYKLGLSVAATDQLIAAAPSTRLVLFPRLHGPVNNNYTELLEHAHAYCRRQPCGRAQHTGMALNKYNEHYQRCKGVAHMCAYATHVICEQCDTENAR